jgi:hypothetical protein
MLVVGPHPAWLSAGRCAHTMNASGATLMPATLTRGGADEHAMQIWSER